jgi:uncharacterized membrane protein
MSQFSKIFFRGLVTLLPIAVTIYIIYSAVIILENLLGSLLRRIFPHYIPGIGFLLILILIFIFGLMLNNLITAKVFLTLENKLTQVPFIKAIYSPLRDLMNLFNKANNQGMKGVVMVKLGPSGATALGIVTRENFKDLPLGDLSKDKVAVYFPLSYGLGGMTFMVPRDMITPVDMPLEKAMSLAITGWVKADSKTENE